MKLIQSLHEKNQTTQSLHEKSEVNITNIFFTPLKGLALPLLVTEPLALDRGGPDALERLSQNYKITVAPLRGVIKECPDD
jgi:hypothetical protein